MGSKNTGTPKPSIMAQNWIEAPVVEPPPEVVAGEGVGLIVQAAQPELPHRPARLRHPVRGVRHGLVHVEDGR